MTSFSRYTDKNKYGGYTWMIKFESVFHIFINSNPDNSFVVDLKEWGFIRYKKTLFSFVSNQGLINTVEEAYEKTITHINQNTKYRIDENIAYNNMNEIVRQFLHSNDSITKKTIFDKTKTLKYKTTKGNVIEVFDNKFKTQTLFVNDELRVNNKFNSIMELEEEFNYMENRLKDAGSIYELIEL